MIQPNFESNKFKKQALKNINQIQKKNLKEMMSFNKPPEMILKLLQTIMWILADVYKQIKIDQTTRDPIDLTWQGCRLMVNHQMNNFYSQLNGIFDGVQKKEIMCRHIQYVKENMLIQNQFNLEYIKKISVAGGYLYGWVINVVKYWDARMAESKQ